jgi:chemotaxis protein MotB
VDRVADEQKKNVTKAPIWLITFGDVVALMLTFFVMLYATAKIPSENWDAVVGTMSNSLRFSQSGRAPNPQSEYSIPIVSLPPALSTEYLAGILRDQLGQDDVLKDAIVRAQDNRVAITLGGGAMFAPGSVTLQDDTAEAIARIGAVLANIPNQVEVRGHAGPSEREGAIFEEIQRLSLQRAASVANALRETGYQPSIIVLGLGDSRIQHINPEVSDALRRALVRRVDIIIHATMENP